MATFYKSPLGKKMLAQEPQVLDDDVQLRAAMGRRASAKKS